MRSLTPKILFFTIIAILLIRCDDSTDIIPNKNYFNSANIKAIYTSLQQKNTDSLISLLNTENPQEKTADIFALASLDDTLFYTVVAPLLNDNTATVRRSAAFALGQMSSDFYESKLIAAFNNESDNFVKRQILIALGKIGTDKALNFTASLNLQSDETQVLQGQGIAFYFFAKRGIITQQMYAKTFEVMNNPDVSEDAKLAYSYLLTLNGLHYANYFKIIENEVLTQHNVYYLTNLVYGLKNIKTSQSFGLIIKVLEADADYRIKISAIKALEAFSYESGKKYVYNALTDNNPQIAVTASEYFLKKGTKADANIYLSYSKKITFWQARSNMLMAALKFSQDKKSISNSIITGYKAAENIYEKASLLYALSENPKQYKFVTDETFSATEKIISTTGMRCLYKMRINPRFKTIASTITQNNENIDAKFKIIVQEAMSKGDPAMVYYAAKLLNYPNVNLIDVFTNTYFLTQAMNTLKLPKDFVAYNELCKAIDNFGGQTCTNDPKIDFLSIDWDYVRSLSAQQRVLVKTNKGNFEITVDVNSCPATAYVFLGLVQSGYYNNTYFAEQDPGKALFTGGKRGDAWQNQNIPLVREISDKIFADGSVVTPVIDKDYNSVNWFITTAPTMEFYGKNTVFGEVTKGLDVVHQLVLGDKILEIRIL